MNPDAGIAHMERATHGQSSCNISEREDGFEGKSTESPVTRLKTQNLDCAAVRTLQRQEAENVS